MKLNLPTKNVFYISLALAVLGLVGFFVSALAPFSFWLVLAAYVLLFLGNTMKGF